MVGNGTHDRPPPRARASSTRPAAWSTFERARSEPAPTPGAGSAACPRRRVGGRGRRLAEPPRGGRIAARAADGRGSTRLRRGAGPRATWTAASRRSSTSSRPCSTGRPTRSPRTRATAPAATLRGMVVRLGELATVGARDPREAVGAVRGGPARAARAGPGTARTSRRRTGSATSSTAAGVEVRDTPAGADWHLLPS